MLNPPAQFGRRLIYNISTRTLIALSCFRASNLLDSTMPKQASINAFQYVLLFNVGKRRGVIKPLRVQRYYKNLIYANLFTKYIRTRIKLREKDEETRSLKERAQDTYLAGHRHALNQKEKGMPEPHTSKGKQLKAKEKIKKNVHEFA